MTEYHLKVLGTSSINTFSGKFDSMDKLKNTIERELRDFQGDDREIVTIVVEENHD